MDYLLCTLLGFAPPFLIIWWFVSRGMRQLGAPAAYREVSRELGLSVDTRGVSLQGHLGDRRIWIGQVLVGHGPDRRHEYWGVLDLERPLGLGLHVQPRGGLLRRRGREMTTGDSDFDRALEVRGDDDGRVRTLLTASVRAALVTLARKHPVEVSDRSVRVHLKQPPKNTATLRDLVSEMLAAAEALEESRRAVDVPEPLEEWVGHWSGLAEQLGVDLEDWLPALSGDLGSRRLLITPRPPMGEAAGWTAELKLFFRPHREIGLRLRPQLEPDGYWSVGQDIQVGDDAFDDAFVIKGYDPVVIVNALDETVRANLLALLEVGPLDVDDRCLRLANAPLDTAALERLLQTAQDAADALGW